MITDELLLANGYKEYEDTFYHADCLFQKRIRDEMGRTMYFINFYKYKENYEVELSLDMEEYAMSTKWYAFSPVGKVNLEVAEKWVYDLWCKMGCPYYEKEEEENE